MTEITDAQIEQLRQHHWPDGVPHDWHRLLNHEPSCRRCGVYIASSVKVCPAWDPRTSIADAMMLLDDCEMWVINKGNDGPKDVPFVVSVFRNGMWKMASGETPAMAITLAALAALEAKGKEALINAEIRRLREENERLTGAEAELEVVIRHMERADRYRKALERIISYVTEAIRVGDLDDEAKQVLKIAKEALQPKEER